MPTKYSKNIFLYILSLIPIIIATPPYLGCGIIIILLLNLLMILGTTFRFVTNKFNTEHSDKIILLLVISFLLTSSWLDLLFARDKYDSPKVFGQNMKYSGLFSLALFFFFLFREIISFGSISIPVRNGVKILKFLPWSGSFWATVPGGFIILGIVLALVILIDKNLDKVRNTDIK